MIIENLKRIIVEDNKVRINVCSQQSGMDFIQIKELGARLNEVIIEGIDAHSTFAFKLDHEDYRLSSYLKASEKDINKGCDAIIFTVFENRHYLFICELKSFDFSGTNVITKMKNSSLFLDYINAILRTFYSSDFLTLFEKKYILFHLKKNNRRRTRPKQGIISKWDIEKIPVFQAYNYRKIHIRQLIDL